MDKLEKYKKSIEYFTFGLLLVLSIFLIVFYLFYSENFWYYQFGDRDLLRSLYLTEQFQLYGPELNHLNGLRSMVSSKYSFSGKTQTL